MFCIAIFFDRMYDKPTMVVLFMHSELDYLSLFKYKEEYPTNGREITSGSGVEANALKYDKDLQ